MYNSKQKYSKLNTVLVKCLKGHEKVYVKRSHRLYFVLDGKGKFQVGAQKYSVKKYDVIVIPPKTKYFYTGKMKLFEVNFPATGSEDEVVVK